MKKIAPPLYAVLLLLVGCLPLVDRPYMSRMIAVSFPAAEAQGSESVSPNDPDVQEALRLIETLLVSEGFGTNTNRMDGNAHGFIVGYAKYNADGMRRVTGPDVYLENRQLEVVFTELGNRSSHFSASTREVFDLLRKQLSNRFGAQRVRVLKPD
jgi:hypothetical protein